MGNGVYQEVVPWHEIAWKTNNIPKNALCSDRKPSEPIPKRVAEINLDWRDCRPSLLSFRVSIDREFSSGLEWMRISPLSDESGGKHGLGRSLH